jgi:hypothetical protein
MRTGVLAAAMLLAAGPACVGEFRCREDSNCDLAVGGRCIDSVCNYGVTVSDSAATTDAPDVTTGEAPACDEYDVVLLERGKATGVALAADGDVFVVGIKAAGDTPSDVRATRLSPTGEARWTASLAETDNAQIDDDTDLWAHAFMPDPAGELLTVVYSLRTLNDDAVSVKFGPYVRDVNVTDGTLRPLDDGLVGYYQSLRGVVMRDAKSMLIAGERQDNLWYQYATRSTGAWTPVWPDLPVPFDELAGYKTPAIAQAIAPLAAPATLVGGTWDRVLDQDDYSAWLRRVDNAGATECECDTPGLGVLAMASTGDSVLVAGLAQEGGQSHAWLARLDPTCPLTCTPPDQDGSSLAWQTRIAGAVVDDYDARPELFRDVVLTIAPLADGGFIAAGALDGKRWIAGHSADGDQRWVLPDSPGESPGAAIAIAVSPDERCLTITGSDDYHDYDRRNWWVRRAKLPD